VTAYAFNASQRPGQPISATAVSVGGDFAHILPCSPGFEDADEYVVLCGMRSPDFWWFPRLPVCPECLRLWTWAAAIDETNRRTVIDGGVNSV